ncbi:MAG: class I SAM-dependent methyltransferase, partial [Clostridia bacterium]|nr:class I SAM-dependent methyltransferase [Clostridia bacterium]
MNFNKELFTENLQGIAVSDKQLELLDSFGALLTEKNKSVNLTSITDPDGIAVKHFADSISLLKADIPQGAKVLDLGCGAGFPGIPLLIMRPDLKLTLLDSTGKKLDFVSEALDALSLEA